MQIARNIKLNKKNQRREKGISGSKKRWSQNNISGEPKTSSSSFSKSTQTFISSLTTDNKHTQTPTTFSEKKIQTKIEQKNKYTDTIGLINNETYFKLRNITKTNLKHLQIKQKYFKILLSYTILKNKQKKKKVKNQKTKLSAESQLKLYILLGTTWGKLLRMKTFFNQHNLNVFESHQSVELLRRKIYNPKQWFFKEVELKNKKTTIIIRRNV